MNAVEKAPGSIPGSGERELGDFDIQREFPRVMVSKEVLRDEQMKVLT